MNPHFPLKASLAIAALLALAPAHAGELGKADYQAGKERISQTYKADKTACASLAGNGKDICIQEAKGREQVTRAELEYSYSAKPEDQNKIGVARAEAMYAVDRERCDDLAGNPKAVCVTQAEAQRTRGLADAKLGRVVGEASRDAAQDKREADYKVAAQKCDALAGEVKASCMSGAKARFGKS